MIANSGYSTILSVCTCSSLKLFIQPNNQACVYLYIDNDLKHRLIFHESMQWSHHIQAMCIKANRSLNFLQQNLSKCSSNVKQNAYITIIRPLLEYAACVWDPYHEY